MFNARTHRIVHANGGSNQFKRVVRLKSSSDNNEPKCKTDPTEAPSLLQIAEPHTHHFSDGEAAL